MDRYIEAATRANTRKSYAAAVRHFEVEWGGCLPTTPDTLARYLASYAEILAVNTLRQRLAGIGQWHQDHGFADPSRTPIVKKVLKGIQALHPAVEKRATPLQLDQLAALSDWLGRAAESARDPAAVLRHRRDRALMLIGFWRGFRGDELIRLRFEHVQLVPGQGLTCFLGSSKTDRSNIGKTYKVPALSRCCPVSAVEDWMAVAGATSGPLFPRISRWGVLSDTALHPNSVIPLLRRILRQAGVSSPELYSAHSLRRGFANWADANGWDAKSLMEYVGWRDVHSAMRYIDGQDAFGQKRIEVALAKPHLGSRSNG